MNTSPSVNTPVTSITGFLGAGKTTLVNRLISYANGLRVVVFVNDFGEINIDHQLIETVEDDRISLKNGCVCCTLNEDLIKSISQFVRQLDPPDHIVIEASGVAKPVILQSSIATLEQAGLVRSDFRICVIDSEQFNTLGYERTEEIIDGAVSSDLVLLNKADLASAENIQSLRAILEVCAPEAKLVETANCELPFDWLCQVPVHRARSRKPLAESIEQRHVHSEEFLSWSRDIGVPLDRRRFLDFLSVMMETAFRAKGIVRFTENPDSGYLVNMVGKRINLECIDKGPQQQNSSIVAIGSMREFNVEKIDSAFRSLLE